MQDGTVQTWGQNHKGQAGTGDLVDHIYTPTGVVTDLGPLTDVASVFGDGFVSGAVTSDGRVFMWGLGTLGQLGQGVLLDGERDLEDRIVASEVAISDADRSLFDIIEGEEFFEIVN